MSTGARFTLLVVDDDATNRDLLTQRLERKGYHVVEAESGPVALDLIEREPIDLVLLDVMMPEMDGLQVLRVIRRTRPALDLPVVMVTALAESSDVVRALEAGANDYITKPIDFAVGLARIENQLLNRRALSAVRSSSPVADGSAAAAHAPLVIAPGTLIDDRYKLEATIGAGGFGAVYRARHVHLDRPVAVKFLQAIGASLDEARERFRREGVSASRLQHPNAVLVMDYGFAGDTPYLVMELLTGSTLADEIARRGYLPTRRALEIVTPVASVLAAAHRVGIIHRDIKPANVFLHVSPVGEVVKVLDFGIAKLLDDPFATRDGLVSGTPVYMAPERFQGVASEPSLDVYSLATMLFEMLAGRPPFLPKSRDPFSLADVKRHEEPPDLTDAAPEAPLAVTDLVMRALSRKPSERPTAGEMERLLAEALAVERAGGDETNGSATAVFQRTPDDDRST